MKLRTTVPGRTRCRRRNGQSKTPSGFLVPRLILMLVLCTVAVLLPGTANTGATPAWAQGSPPGTPASAATQPGTQPRSTPTAEPGSGQVPRGDLPVQESLEAQVLTSGSVKPCTDSGMALGESSAANLEPQHCQKVELLITKGSLKGQKVTVEEGRLPVASKADITYQPGDRVLVDYLHGAGQPAQFVITDFIRTGAMLILALVFVAVAILFAGFRGFTSMLGLVISFTVLILFVLPRIIAGDDPVVITILGSIVIMIVTLYLSHGFNRKTTSALLGTAISLVLTGLLALIAINLIRLSGAGTDEATLLQISAGGAINMRGLLLGGIIIGALGVLNDVTIGQASAVFELHNIDPTMGWRRLFGHVSNIGKDHIAATVNTLVLAYAGASLPLLILFVTGSDSWDHIVNQEIVAEEVVRTLVGSIGLIASVPVTTWLAALIAVRTPAQLVPASAENMHSHAHHH